MPNVAADHRVRIIDARTGDYVDSRYIDEDLFGPHTIVFWHDHAMRDSYWQWSLRSCDPLDWNTFLYPDISSTENREKMRFLRERYLSDD